MHLLRAVTGEDFGLAIRRAREHRGLQQADLAERVGVTRMTISRLERGQAVSTTTAIRALSECGFEVLIAPKFSRVTLESD